jgi:hypothetical protein
MQAHGGKLCLRPSGLAARSFAFVYVLKIHNTQSPVAAPTRLANTTIFIGQFALISGEKIKMHALLLQEKREDYFCVLSGARHRAL